jgi:uncharacterized cupin superfamily protein
MGIRRVVTGQRADGTSVYVSDEVVEPVLPPLLGGNEVFQLWGADTATSLPTDGGEPAHDNFFPPADGYRLHVFTMPPQSFAAPEIQDFDAALAETERLTPGMTGAVTDNSGMHYTDTVDLLYIMSGEVHLELDGGETKILRKGDVIIQNGTNHAWYNRHGTEKAELLLVFIGARRGA